MIVVDATRDLLMNVLKVSSIPDQSQIIHELGGDFRSDS